MIKPTIISNSKNWMESIAISQLEGLSKLPGVVKSVELPDLHAGRTPIGIGIITQEIIYPYIIGTDIGCGMSLFNTNIDSKKLKLERWTTKLNSIRELSDVPLYREYDEEPSPIYDLGTIGGGNHFSEFQVVEKIYNIDEFKKLTADEKNIFLLVHSGSRGYGQKILGEFSITEGINGNSDLGNAYISKHNNALKWASINRIAISEKLINYLGYGIKSETLIDCAHNFLETIEINGNKLFIHRKGTVSSLSGLVVIPGSRGALTYIVKPKEDTEKSAWCLSHGAGRKWSRSLCKARVKDKYTYKSIRETRLLGRVVCHDTDLLYAEAPEAYKNINNVIESLVEHDLIEVVATLKPVLTFKG